MKRSKWIGTSLLVGFSFPSLAHPAHDETFHPWEFCHSYYGSSVDTVTGIWQHRVLDCCISGPCLDQFNKKPELCYVARDSEGVLRLEQTEPIGLKPRFVEAGWTVSLEVCSE